MPAQQILIVIYLVEKRFESKPIFLLLNPYKAMLEFE
jgi:hypothetical protein